MGADKRAVYDELAGQLAGLIAGEADLIANPANMAALLYHRLPEINWAGFYLARKSDLVIGPFQGKPACVRIAWGNGVCGSPASRGVSIVVPDVDEFPGHIACDAASPSGLILPLLAEGRAVGVFVLVRSCPARLAGAAR